MRTTASLSLAFLLGAAAAHAQTAEELVAKNTEAKGGLDRIKAIKSVRMKGTVIQGGFTARIGQDAKRPDMLRQTFTIQGMTAVQAYDGRTGWQISPFGGRKDPELLGEDDAKSLVVDADIDGPLVDYKEKGHKAELVGHDSMEGTDCFKIKLSMKNGDVRYYYRDADSYLELKLEIQTTIRGALQENELE